jgi:dolichol kinase
MIGNLPFLIPLFSSSLYPFLVASPFILVTFIASPYSPLKGINLRGLSDLTEEGHGIGLVLYAISYSVLALFFGSDASIIAAGILPMAYGDSLAAIIGERFGRLRYRIFDTKSLEGSISMLMASFVSLVIGFTFFNIFYSFSIPNYIFTAGVIAILVTVAEALSPKGFDNISIPATGAISFILLNRWL